jgi:hypothetical protein
MKSAEEFETRVAEEFHFHASRFTFEARERVRLLPDPGEQ